MTKANLGEDLISLQDARLLDHFARYMVLFTMVELCEVLVPLVYMIVLLLLNSDTFGSNRKYFALFADDGQVANSIRGNSFALLIEASVFLFAQSLLLRSVGFNLAHFTGAARCSHVLSRVDGRSCSADGFPVLELRSWGVLCGMGHGLDQPFGAQPDVSSRLACRALTRNLGACCVHV